MTTPLFSSNKPTDSRPSVFEQEAQHAFDEKRVRSTARPVTARYALAVFLVAKGVSPLSVRISEGSELYTFPVEARPFLGEYHEAKRVLDTLQLQG